LLRIAGHRSVISAASRADHSPNSINGSPGNCRTPWSKVTRCIPAVSDAGRVAHFECLAKKLCDLNFRRIEGAPIGNDEAIMVLSAPTSLHRLPSTQEFQMYT
jgi:hypothetical protein